MLAKQGLVGDEYPAGAFEHPLAPHSPPCTTDARGQLHTAARMGLHAAAASGDVNAEHVRVQHTASDAAAEGQAPGWGGWSGDGSLQMRLPQSGVGAVGYEDDGLVGFEQQQQPGDAGG
jgi:hypothetical protein